MSQRYLSDRRRNNEEEYFHRLDLELLNQMRTRAILEEERIKLAKASHITDESVLEALAHVGFSDTNAILLHFVPMVEVAWSDGSVSRPERDLIVALARSHGIVEDDSADRQLQRWLDRKPSQAVLQTAVRALRAILESLPRSESDPLAHLLLKDWVDVAAASGGFLGISSSVSAVEQGLIEHLARQIDFESSDLRANLKNGADQPGQGAAT
jgi:hypothetical protein